MIIIKIVGYIPNNSDEERFHIVDAATGVVIDNAQGAGFRSYEKAEKYATVHRNWLLDASNKPIKTQLNELF
ncbi:MAG: hypothetical protein NC453_30515 [Muribaculum sp.]|nr:hypothetical protein [Muribaculum sp.]